MSLNLVTLLCLCEIDFEDPLILLGLVSDDARAAFLVAARDLDL